MPTEKSTAMWLPGARLSLIRLLADTRELVHVLQAFSGVGSSCPQNGFREFRFMLSVSSISFRSRQNGLREYRFGHFLALVKFKELRFRHSCPHKSTTWVPGCQIQAFLALTPEVGKTFSKTSELDSSVEQRSRAWGSEG